MSARIRTNTSSLTALRSLKGHNRKIEKKSAQLSSGERITVAADDAAGLSISQKLKANILGKKQAFRNANDAVSVVQVAEGALNELSEMVIRMRELNIQALSDTYSDSQRKLMDLEVQQLLNEVKRISQSTKYNSTNLLQGEQKHLDIQVDTNATSQDRISINLSNLAQTPMALGIYDVRIDSRLHARLSLEKLDFAIDEISHSRAELGALQSRFNSAAQNLSTANENLSRSNSQIRDTDYAIESSRLISNKLKQQTATSALHQANNSAKNYLKLIG